MQILWAPAHLDTKTQTQKIRFLDTETQVSQEGTYFCGHPAASVNGHCALEVAAMWEMSNGQSEVSGRRQFLPCMSRACGVARSRMGLACLGCVRLCARLAAIQQCWRKERLLIFPTNLQVFSRVLVTQLWKMCPVWLSWSEIQIPPHADLETAPFAYSERFLCQWSLQLYTSWWLKLFYYSLIQARVFRIQIPFYCLRIYKIYITVASHKKQSLPSLGSSPCWWMLLLSTLHLPAYISQPWTLLSGSSWQGCVFLQCYHYKFLEHWFKIATFTVTSFWCYLDNLQGNFLCFWVRVSDSGPEMLWKGCSIFCTLSSLSLPHNHVWWKVTVLKIALAVAQLLWYREGVGEKVHCLHFSSLWRQPIHNHGCMNHCPHGLTGSPYPEL